jgi:hypothetical protein
MKKFNFLKLFVLSTFSLASWQVAAQFQGGVAAQGQWNSGGGGAMQGAGGMMYQQPAMQPGMYQAPPPRGPGEHMAYQAGHTMPCSPRGGYSAIEGPIANGMLINPAASGTHQ